MVRAGEAAPTGSGARAGTGPSAEFEGVWTTAFEVSVFRLGVDCAADAPLYWLTATRDFYDQISAYRGSSGFSSSDHSTSYRVRFIGRLSIAGSYGHLGRYAQQVAVERLLDIGAPPKCPTP